MSTRQECGRVVLDGLRVVRGWSGKVIPGDRARCLQVSMVVIQVRGASGNIQNTDQIKFARGGGGTTIRSQKQLLRIQKGVRVGNRSPDNEKVTEGV